MKTYRVGKNEHAPFFALLSLLGMIALMPSLALSSGYLTNLAQGVYIQKVFAHSGEGITLFVDANELNNPDSCGDLSKVHIKAENPTVISVALMAYATGKRLGMHSSGCEIIPFWGGTITRPVAINAWMLD